MRALVLCFLLTTACSGAERRSFGFPEGEAASRILVVRVSEGVRYYAINETVDFTQVQSSDGEVQLLNLDYELSQLGLHPGEIFSSESSNASAFPPAESIWNLDIEAERWREVDLPWPEARAFRFVAPVACRSFEMPTEAPEDLPLRLRGAERVRAGEILLISSATTAGDGSGVYYKSRGQPLQTLTVDAETRLSLTSVAGRYWIGGSKLWRVESLSPWSAIEIADKSALNGESIVSLTGPLQTSTKRYEVVGYTRQGSLFGAAGNTVEKIATVRPTTHASYALTRQNGQLLFSGGTLSNDEVREEYLTLVDGDRITTVIVPRNVIEGGSKDRPISGLDESADGRLFIAANRIGEFVSLDPLQVELWSDASEPSPDSLTIVGDLALSTMGRRTLWQLPVVEQLGPKCSTSVARFGPTGYVTFAKAMEDGGDIVWVGQSTEDDQRYFTSFVWLQPATD